jgi:hypothetical protein
VERRSHEQRPEFVGLEEVPGELTQAHEPVHGFDDTTLDDQRLECISLAPRRRSAEAVLAEGMLPPGGVGVEEPEVEVGVGVRGAADGLLGATDTLVPRLLGSAVVDHPVGGPADERRPVVEDHRLVALGEDVAQSLVVQVEVAVGGVGVEPRPV